MLFYNARFCILKGIRGTEIAKFQVKGNTTSRLSNLKIEGTGKGEYKIR